MNIPLATLFVTIASTPFLEPEGRSAFKDIEN
jgi:hypothetical protein